MGRTLFPFLLGVLAGVLLAESARYLKDKAGDGDFDTVADRVSDRLDELERGLASQTA